MPVGKLSAVEHNELAGESACPTYSASTGGKSQENVDNSRAGFQPARFDRGHSGSGCARSSPGGAR
jgi:hypothetical protein